MMRISRTIQKCIVHILLLSSLFPAALLAGEKPPAYNYCERLEQAVQGRKHGFMAGNITYYIGGFMPSWNRGQEETIGLTHPFHHDLRSRGIGLVESSIEGTEHTGVGNDYSGWEFYKDTRVLYGSVIINGETFKNPVPQSMQWRPDKMICQYAVGGVTIYEEKFIAPNDAAASVIRSTEPVTLEFSGHSFYHRKSVRSTATARYDRSSNALVIREGGTVESRPDPNAPAREGPCVYEGMSTVLSASRSFAKSHTIRRDDRNVVQYTLSVPCDDQGTTVVWAMNDSRRQALKDASDLLRHTESALLAKTREMNRQLNEEVPYFRCSEAKFVDIYYYLWSIYLMYYIDVQKGWEMENHTQTAVNNFLGMHRYDATFQIKVGAWTQDKARYAYGNVLTWKHLTKNDRYRQLGNGSRLISDNKGISWHSGAYGGETPEHVLGAWQIYQHTGDVAFLKDCYEDHFKKLFYQRIGGFAMNTDQVAETLVQIASLTGNHADVPHWESFVRDPEVIRRDYDRRWEANGVENFFGAAANGMYMTNSFWCMRSPYFPREYAERFVEHWALDKEKGYYGVFFPLAMAKQSMQTFATPVDHSFGYTPDTAYFTIDGMFQQGLDVAPELAVNHLENYNYREAWGIPVAPEAYKRNLDLFGDQYSNFNAGKILFYLEGFGGLRYSIPENQLTIRPAMPTTWDWMEIRLPIKGQWTKIRYSAESVEVSGCPLDVVLPEAASEN
ncbi:MAG: hypothetical protein CBC33_002065 [Coraliomargarita sp. TMED73]|nr:MAG: hypothetical protein CBC33_002065 [Coraliomargarita sp. TMED73]